MLLIFLTKFTKHAISAAQNFYCFGCQAAGDAISFVRKINSIDYPEAVKLLAARAGMPEPQEDDKTGRMRSRILSMNKNNSSNVRMANSSLMPLM